MIINCGHRSARSPRRARPEENQSFPTRAARDPLNLSTSRSRLARLVPTVKHQAVRQLAEPGSEHFNPQLGPFRFRLRLIRLLLLLVAALRPLLFLVVFLLHLLRFPLMLLL